MPMSDDVSMKMDKNWLILPIGTKQILPYTCENNFTEKVHKQICLNIFRTVHLDEHFFTCHQTVSVYQSKWFPGSSSDVHLLVLTSDNRIR